MVNASSLPNAASRIVDMRGSVTQEWRDFFLRLASQTDNAVLEALYVELAKRVDQLEAGLRIVGPYSVRVVGTPDDGFIQVSLLGDKQNPGAKFYYGTNAAGTKGWHEVEVTLDGEETLTNKTLVAPTLRGGNGASLSENLTPIGESGDLHVVDFGSPAGWSDDGVGGLLHTPGSTDPLSLTGIPVVSGSAYMASVFWSGATAGTITVSLGSYSAVLPDESTPALLTYFDPDGTDTFSITPSNDFDGSVAFFSLQRVIPATNTDRVHITNETGSVNEDLFTPASGSLAFGDGALQNVLGSGAGANNFGLGRNALQQLIAGTRNTAIGAEANGSPQLVSSSTSIGSLAAAEANNSTAIGVSSRVDAAYPGAVALGHESQNTRAATVAVGARDVHVQGDGLGLLCPTPDGTALYRISVDNTGAVISTLL